MVSKIIACDFDDTLCINAYPKIGEPKLEIITALVSEKQNGAKLILWTCRNGKELDEAVEWCKKYNLTFDAINDDLEKIKNSDFGKNKSKKVFATEYWDDRAIHID